MYPLTDTVGMIQVWHPCKIVQRKEKYDLENSVDKNKHGLQV